MSLVEALQSALAIEHQAVYGYGVVGAYAPVIAPPSPRPRGRGHAADRLREHKILRDRLAALVHELGSTPVAAEAAYALPFPVRTRPDATRLARLLEAATEGAAWSVVTASGRESPARKLMVAALADAARWDAWWATDASGLAVDTPVPALPGQPS